MPRGTQNPVPSKALRCGQNCWVVRTTGHQIAHIMLHLWRGGAADLDRDPHLRDLEERSFASAAERSFILGQAYQLAGDFQKAQASYRQIPADDPMRLQAELYAGNASHEMLRRDTMADEKDQRHEQHANLRLEAVMKLRRAGTDDIQQALGLLQSVVNSSNPDNIDRILMANCYEQLGKPGEAVQQLEIVVEEEPTAYHLTLLIDLLLRDGQFDKAEIWIDQLEEQTGWEKKTVMLRSRWMVATNRMDEIKPFVERFAAERFQKQAADPAREMRDISEIYRQVGMSQDAERWLERLAQRFPNRFDELSELLAESDETARAVDRCVQLLKTEPNVGTATLLARIVVYGEADTSTVDNVLPVLETCYQQFADDPSFVFAMGNVYIRRSDHQKAIELLRRVTELQPGHYLAWNNLAALLAEQEGRQAEAMTTIEQAIDQAAYEIPTLLDTKAVVLLHQGMYQPAADLLRAEVTSSRAATDPRFYFHLALALHGMSDEAAAKAALQEAIDLDLDKSFLTDFERTEWSRLNHELGLELE